VNDDPDAPEDLLQYLKRHLHDKSNPIPVDWTREDRDEYKKTLSVEWRQLEHQKTLRRAEKQHLERHQKELDRKREREEEQERRNPTPKIKPSTYPIDLPDEIREQHIFVPGMTRHGKSTQLLRIITADIENGEGVAVLDPKGDLIRHICAILPENRIQDCIYLDLETPIPLDIIRPTVNPEYLVGDIKALVLKGDTTLKRAEPILTRIIYTLLAVPETRFTDIEEIFTNPIRKKEILDVLERTDPERRQYWAINWPAQDRWEPLVARMTDFTQNRSLRTILGDKKPRLDLRREMDTRKIILVNLSGTGEVREIYGSLLVSRFQQAAYSRTDTHPSKRVPFHLFVDEFENFQTSSFAKIFSVAGGLGLRLTVGNQYIDQLSEDIRHAVIGNAGSFIIFKIRECLPLFETVIHPYNTKWLGLLPRYQAVYKIGDEPPIFKWTPKPPDFSEIEEQQSDQMIARLKANTLRDYGPTPDTSGQNSPKRTGDKSAGNATGNVVPLKQDAPTDANGNSTDPLLPKRPQKAGS
jgi:hypothetical protein